MQNECQTCHYPIDDRHRYDCVCFWKKVDKLRFEPLKAAWSNILELEDQTGLDLTALQNILYILMEQPK